MVIILETPVVVIQTTVEHAAPKATVHHVIRATFITEHAIALVQQPLMLLVQVAQHV